LISIIAHSELLPTLVNRLFSFFLFHNHFNLIKPLISLQANILLQQLHRSKWIHIIWSNAIKIIPKWTEPIAISVIMVITRITITTQSIVATTATWQAAMTINYTARAIITAIATTNQHIITSNSITTVVISNYTAITVII